MKTKFLTVLLVFLCVAATRKVMMSPKQASMISQAVVAPPGATLMKMERHGFSNYWYYSTIVTNPVTSNFYFTNFAAPPPPLFNVAWKSPVNLLVSSNLTDWVTTQQIMLCSVAFTNWGGSGFLRVPLDTKSGVIGVNSNSISFTWQHDDPSSSFNLYQGKASRAYDTIYQAGTSHFYLVNGLKTNVWYFFTPSAVNAMGVESAYGPEISVLLNQSTNIVYIDLTIR